MATGMGKRRTGNAFRRGHLFPKLAGAAGKERQVKQMRHLRRMVANEKAGERWPVLDFPLKNYVYLPEKNVPKFNFESFLLKKIEDAEKRGEKLRVLDVGIGTGKQWADFLEKHGHRFELVGTVLYRNYLHPKMTDLSQAGKAKIVSSTAANLHAKFPSNHFDIVASNFGTHQQDEEALESILHVLKPGGEALVRGGSLKKMPTSSKHRDFYGILRHAKDIIYRPKTSASEGSFGWFYHIRKNQH